MANHPTYPNERMRHTTVYLPQSAIAQAREIGGGNLSRGIVMAVQAEAERRGKNQENGGQER